MVDFWTTLSLTPSQGIALVAIAFVAGLVRGFTGFALSAVGLALAVLILPPAQLIPVMWWLELSASLVMLRHGWGGADVRAALILVAGSVFGLFAGLSLTTTIDPGISQQIALVVLIVLALLQLTGMRVPRLNSTIGTIVTGLVAGVVTGLAGIGGMVVALYVLARADEPAVMRATLVAYLFIGSLISFGMHLWFGTMNTTATLRGLAFIAPCIAGVLVGARLFTPRLQPYYRPTCLTLLIGLGAISLTRSIL